MINCARILLCAAVLASGTAAYAQTKPDGVRAGIGYASVAEAQAALRAKPGVKFSKNGDWTIANDVDGAIWSFTPEGHYAHPSVGRRWIFEKEGAYYVQTQILCQAAEAACEKLRSDYQLLDRRMTEAIRARH